MSRNLMTIHWNGVQSLTNYDPNVVKQKNKAELLITCQNDGLVGSKTSNSSSDKRVSDCVLRPPLVNVVPHYVSTSWTPLPLHNINFRLPKLPSPLWILNVFCPENFLNNIYIYMYKDFLRIILKNTCSVCVAASMFAAWSRNF